MLRFRVETTLLEAAGNPVVSYLTLSELKTAIKNHRAEVSLRDEVLQQTRFWSHAPNLTGRPQFVSVNLENEPILILIRVCSEKEYCHAKNEERLDNQAAWEAYGERKAGC